MLFLQRIALTQFRNYIHQSFDITERIVAISGNNGTGKTNLLDAIYYLCFTKSYFAKPDGLNAHNGLQGFRLEGLFMKNEQHSKLVYIQRENNRKEFLLNDQVYKKFSEHIGKFPCVMIAPDDVEIITGGSEQRRIFIDTIISQLNAGYLQHLIAYNKILQQRNSLLKAAAEYNRIDEELLAVFDKQLCTEGSIVFEQRKIFLKNFIPLATQEYNMIAGDKDTLQVEYESQLEDNDFAVLLSENRQRDIYLQRTGCGVHKDDIIFKMRSQPFKIIASQGQRKSLLFALKLAEYEKLKKEKGFAPLLLLDDVFEKLDAQRMQKLLHRVCVQEYGQVFITDTHQERLQHAFSQPGVNFQLINLS